jgi:epoxyqueuosine reductase
VRGAAIWALSRLLPASDFAELAQTHGDEPDPEVRAEWIKG